MRRPLLPPHHGFRTARANIVAASDAWLRYRKYACASEADAYSGGTLSAVVAAQCLARITRERAR